MTMQSEIKVKNSIDVIDARMKVREAARHLGLSLTDQAIISMTTYMVANSLGQGKYGAPNGLIQVKGCQSGTNRGIQVTCSQAGSDGKSLSIAYYQKLVDEVILRKKDPDIYEVTLTMWAKL